MVIQVSVFMYVGRLRSLCNLRKEKLHRTVYKEKEKVGMWTPCYTQSKLKENLGR